MNGGVPHFGLAVEKALSKSDTFGAVEILRSVPSPRLELKTEALLKGLIVTDVSVHEWRTLRDKKLHKYPTGVYMRDTTPAETYNNLTLDAYRIMAQRVNLPLRSVADIEPTTSRGSGRIGEPPSSIWSVTGSSLWSSVDAVYSCLAGRTRGTLFDRRDPGWSMERIRRSLPCQPSALQHQNTTQLSFGSGQSMSGLFMESSGLSGVYYHHAGRPRVWFSLAPQHNERIDAFLRNADTDNAQMCHGFLLNHRTHIVNPMLLRRQGFQVKVTVSMPGSWIVIPANTYVMYVDCGFNMIEHMRFYLPTSVHANALCVCGSRASVAGKQRKCVCSSGGVSEKGALSNLCASCDGSAPSSAGNCKETEAKEDQKCRIGSCRWCLQEQKHWGVRLTAQDITHWQSQLASVSSVGQIRNLSCQLDGTLSHFDLSFTRYTFDQKSTRSLRKGSSTKCKSKKSTIPMVATAVEVSSHCRQKRALESLNSQQRALLETKVTGAPVRERCLHCAAALAAMVTSITGTSSLEVSHFFHPCLYAAERSFAVPATVVKATSMGKSKAKSMHMYGSAAVPAIVANATMSTGVTPEPVQATVVPASSSLVPATSSRQLFVHASSLIVCNTDLAKKDSSINQRNNGLHADTDEWDELMSIPGVQVSLHRHASKRMRDDTTVVWSSLNVDQLRSVPETCFFAEMPVAKDANADIPGVGARTFTLTRLPSWSQVQGISAQDLMNACEQFSSPVDGLSLEKVVYTHTARVAPQTALSNAHSIADDSHTPRTPMANTRSHAPRDARELNMHGVSPPLHTAPGSLLHVPDHRSHAATGRDVTSSPGVGHFDYGNGGGKSKMSNASINGYPLLPQSVWTRPSALEAYDLCATRAEADAVQELKKGFERIRTRPFADTGGELRSPRNTGIVSARTLQVKQPFHYGWSALYTHVHRAWMSKWIQPCQACDGCRRFLSADAAKKSTVGRGGRKMMMSVRAMNPTQLFDAGITGPPPEFLSASWYCHRYRGFWSSDREALAHRINRVAHPRRSRDAAWRSHSTGRFYGELFVDNVFRTHPTSSEGLSCHSDERTRVARDGTLVPVNALRFFNIPLRPYVPMKDLLETVAVSNGLAFGVSTRFSSLAEVSENSPRVAQPPSSLRCLDLTGVRVAHYNHFPQHDDEDMELDAKSASETDVSTDHRSQMRSPSVNSSNTPASDRSRFGSLKRELGVKGSQVVFQDSAIEISDSGLEYALHRTASSNIGRQHRGQVCVLQGNYDPVLLLPLTCFLNRDLQVVDRTFVDRHDNVDPGQMVQAPVKPCVSLYTKGFVERAFDYLQLQYFYQIRSDETSNMQSVHDNRGSANAWQRRLFELSLKNQSSVAVPWIVQTLLDKTRDVPSSRRLRLLNEDKQTVTTSGSGSASLTIPQAVSGSKAPSSPMSALLDTDAGNVDYARYTPRALYSMVSPLNSMTGDGMRSPRAPLAGNSLVVPSSAAVVKVEPKTADFVMNYKGSPGSPTELAHMCSARPPVYPRPVSKPASTHRFLTLPFLQALNRNAFHEGQGPQHMNMYMMAGSRQQQNPVSCLRDSWLQQCGVLGGKVDGPMMLRTMRPDEPPVFLQTVPSHDFMRRHSKGRTPVARIPYVESHVGCDRCGARINSVPESLQRTLVFPQEGGLSHELKRSRDVSGRWDVLPLRAGSHSIVVAEVCSSDGVTSSTPVSMVGSVFINRQRHFQQQQSMRPVVIATKASLAHSSMTAASGAGRLSTREPQPVTPHMPSAPDAASPTTNPIFHEMYSVERSKMYRMKTPTGAQPAFSGIISPMHATDKLAETPYAGNSALFTPAVAHNNTNTLAPLTVKPLDTNEEFTHRSPTHFTGTVRVMETPSMDQGVEPAHRRSHLSNLSVTTAQRELTVNPMQFLSTPKIVTHPEKPSSGCSTNSVDTHRAMLTTPTHGEFASPSFTQPSRIRSRSEAGLSLTPRGRMAADKHRRKRVKVASKHDLSSSDVEGCLDSILQQRTRGNFMSVRHETV